MKQKLGGKELKQKSGAMTVSRKTLSITTLTIKNNKMPT